MEQQLDLSAVIGFQGKLSPLTVQAR